MNAIKVQKGDKVLIKGCAEEKMYRNCVFEVLSNPYVLCGTEVVKIKCNKTGKYFGGGFATEFLERAEDEE